MCSGVVLLVHNVFHVLYVVLIGNAQELKAKVEEMEAELATRHARELAEASRREGGDDDEGAAEGKSEAAAAAPVESAAAASAGADGGAGGDDAAAGEPKGKSRAQKKRDKKKEHERQEREELAAYKATAVDPRIEELVALARVLDPLDLTVHEVCPSLACTSMSHIVLLCPLAA